MRDIELTINRLAQDLIPIKNGIEWFSKSSEAERKEIMHSLDNCIFQSHPSVEDIELGIIKSGLKETFSPCVLIRAKPFNEVRQKVLIMNGLDQERSFKLFVAIFSIADERRRTTECINGCTHEWHHISRCYGLQKI